jgi:hypothetical protein
MDVRVKLPNQDAKQDGGPNDILTPLHWLLFVDSTTTRRIHVCSGTVAHNTSPTFVFLPIAFVYTLNLEKKWNRFIALALALLNIEEKIFDRASKESITTSPSMKC